MVALKNFETLGKVYDRLYKETFILQKTFNSDLILSSGMPRSASTLLYNILRLALEQKYKKDLNACWIYDIEEYTKAKVYLIKMHDLRLTLTKYRANMIFYSYRDVRDSLVSLNKIFKIEPNIDLCRKFIKDYHEAKKRGAYFFRYEQLTKNETDVISKILRILDIDIDTKYILEHLPKPNLKTSLNHDRISLMHGGHMTGTKNNEWRNYLSESLQKQIIDEFGWWFSENGYPLD